MFKKFIGGFLLAVMLQGSAYAGTFAESDGRGSFSKGRDFVYLFNFLISIIAGRGL